MKPVPESDDEDEGPMVVTRKRQKVDSDGPSMKSEIFKTALVGLLGVGTWYVQSVMFAPKPVSVLEKIDPPVIPPPVVAPTAITPAATAKPSPALTPILTLPPKKKVGYSGLYEKKKKMASRSIYFDSRFRDVGKPASCCFVLSRGLHKVTNVQIRSFSFDNTRSIFQPVGLYKRRHGYRLPHRRSTWILQCN